MIGFSEPLTMGKEKVHINVVGKSSPMIVLALRKLICMF